MCRKGVKCNVFEDDARSIGFDLHPSQHQEGLRLHVQGGKGLFVS